MIQQYLSQARLGTYVGACGGDLGAALGLYRWNASVSAAFWEVLGHGEVILRNAMHDQLSAHHQRRGLPGEWFDDPQGVFNNRTTDDVQTAKRRAGRGVRRARWSPSSRSGSGATCSPIANPRRCGRRSATPSRSYPAAATRGRCWRDQ